MKSVEKLYLAIGEIDDSIIKEASEPYNYKINIIKRLSTIAAAVIIISAVGVISMGTLASLMKGGLDAAPDMGEMPNMGECAPSPAPDFGENDESDNDGGINNEYIASDFGYLILTKYKNGCFSFDYTVFAQSASPVYVKLYESGVLIGTSESTASGELKSIKLMVNGEICSTLPTSVGTYTVKIDVGEIDWSKAYIHIDGFGPIKPSY